MLSVKTELSLTELESYDPANRHGSEWRFCCPLPACADKRVSRDHRSISVNMSSGAWHCHRCGASGLLREWHTERRAYSPTPMKLRSRKTARSAFRISSAASPSVVPAIPVENYNWQELLAGITPFPASPAEEYLHSRGMDALFPTASGVKFSSNWFGHPAVVFPIRNKDGRLVAAQGRYLDPQSNPKTRTAQALQGSAKDGVFSTPEAFHQDEIIITEAPIDALSLALCGFPALATIGTHFPDWLPRACAFKPVYLATDADTGGDTFAARLAAALPSFGATVYRLRPDGEKDWNAVLMAHGRQALRSALERVIRQ
ncbi:MAG TPA: toprim domain-containing protein [Armatimonadota bacterium]|nr:toprim domain-containing protein [Armatimonadota bacterium]